MTPIAPPEPQRPAAAPTGDDGEPIAEPIEAGEADDEDDLAVYTARRVI